MTQPFSGIPSVGAAGAEGVTRSTFGPVVDLTSTASQPGATDGLQDAFRATLETFQSAGSRMERVNGAGAATDPVAAAKADLADTVPNGNSLVVGAPQPAAAPSADGSAMLRKSFDHALFVSLVSQIVGGASQATSTLIKQQ